MPPPPNPCPSFCSPASFLCCARAWLFSSFLQLWRRRGRRPHSEDCHWSAGSLWAQAEVACLLQGHGVTAAVSHKEWIQSLAWVGCEGTGSGGPGHQAKPIGDLHAPGRTPSGAWRGQRGHGKGQPSIRLEGPCCLWGLGIWEDWWRIALGEPPRHTGLSPVPPATQSLPRETCLTSCV